MIFIKQLLALAGKKSAIQFDWMAGYLLTIKNQLI